MVFWPRGFSRRRSPPEQELATFPKLAFGFSAARQYLIKDTKKNVLILFHFEKETYFHFEIETYFHFEKETHYLFMNKYYRQVMLQCKN